MEKKQKLSTLTLIGIIASFEDGRRLIQVNREAKLQAIKAIRDITGLGLVEAKLISDYLFLCTNADTFTVGAQEMIQFCESYILSLTSKENEIQSLFDKFNKF